MRLVMFGTGPFAVPTFRGLFETHHELVALLTSPLRPVRGKRLQPVTPMRDVAHEHGTPILEPEDVNSSETQQQLRALHADLFVVCDYGQILSAATLATARLGGINLHGSLLPRYRGAAPINWAIYHGETQTGVTVIHMTPRVDAGPCIAQATTPIDPEETAVELEQRLCESGGWLIRQAIDSIEAGRLEALPQDSAQASRAPRLKKTDGIIDWNRPAQAIKNHIRAMEPWPKTYTHWHRDDGPALRLILGPASVLQRTLSEAPGTVLEAQGGELIVATSDGALSLHQIQPSGKRMLPTEEFLRGYRVQPGDRFGPESPSAPEA